MNLETFKYEFIKLKREELDYINNIAKISSHKKLSECEKLEIYRTLNSYQVKLAEMKKNLLIELKENRELMNRYYDDVIIEFDVDGDFLSSLKFNYEEQKKRMFNDLGIDEKTFKFRLRLKNLFYIREEYRRINPNIIQNNQKLIEKPIYIFDGYYDYSEDCYGPYLGEPDDNLYGIYEEICKCNNNDEIKVSKKDMAEFEKDKIIFCSKIYVHSSEIRIIFEEELLNDNNKTLNDCVIRTKKRIDELNYTRSPEYKEKKILDRINEIYKKVRGEFIQKETLYDGAFLGILRETYRLPNEKIVKKEKIVKNGGKNSVIVIAITQDKEYIITFQNRINDKIIAEFPSGYIENDEDPIEAAKRELKEETGYISDDLFIVDEAYTSPGIDNSVTHIVIANNCLKNDEQNNSGTELVDYGLFSEIELEYLINNNIMNGAMNKLAYYNLINNVDSCNITYLNSNKKIYKIEKKRNLNPL